MEWFDDLLTPIASGAGLPVDQFKFVLFILLSYPLGFLHLRISSSVLIRHLYATIIGFAFLILSFGYIGLFHFLMSSFLVYGLVLVLGHSKAPTIGFVVMMGYLSFLHIYRMYYDYMGWRMDVTAVVMVSTIKITTLCCNYADGFKPETQVAKSARPYAIKKLPNILEYLSFLCYFPTFLAGPAFHFKTYMSYLDDSMYGEDGPPSTASQILASLKIMVVAICCVATYMFLGPIFPMEVFFKEGVEGISGSLFYKFAYLHIALLVKRCQYYFVWKLSEGAAIMAGMGFNGYIVNKNGTKTAKFDGICNIDIFKCEFPLNVRDYTTNWNMKTAEWLRIYVYDRLQNPDPTVKQTNSNAMLITNTVSAFWHGFYPGYYFAFGYASFIIEEMRIIRSTIRPYFMLPRKTDKDGKLLPEVGNYPIKYLYDAAGIVATWITFDSGMGYFNALAIPNCIVYMGHLYYSPLIGAAIAYPVLLMLSSALKKKEKKETTTVKKDQ